MITANYNRIRVVLFEKNVTQEEFAKQIGKSTTTVGNWCRNESQPSLKTLFEIAEAAQCNVCDLLTNSEKVRT